MKPMTKQQLVKLINAYPGDPVTTRPKKSVLEEILRERIEDARMEDAAQAARQFEDDMDEVCCDMVDCCPKNDELGATGRIALVAIVVGGLAGILYLFT